MSARAVITMSPEQYLAGLKQLEAATNKSASKMENSFKEYGTSINKAGIAMRYVSSEMGAGAVAFGRAFQVLAGGKIAIAVAAVAGAFVELKKVWDKLTVSEEEYNTKLEKTIELQQKELDKLRKSQSEEESMMERLDELAKRQDKTNEEKSEAITLAETLAGKYGHLGVSISDLTGDYETLLKSIKKISEEQKNQKIASLENVLSLEKTKASASASNYLSGSFKDNYFYGNYFRNQAQKEAYESLDTAGRLAVAKGMIDPSNKVGAKTDDAIKFWSEQATALTTIIEYEKQLEMLRKTGVETIAEQNKKKKDASEESRKVQEAEDAAWKARVAELDEEARKQEEIDRKHGEALAKELEKEQQIARERQKAAEQRRTNDIASLRGAAYRALGMDEQADIESAIYAEIQANGGDIDSKTRKEITARVKARRALSAAMQTSTSPELYAPRVNSLIARGGSSAPVKMPEVEKLQNKQLDAQNKTNQIAQRILNQMDNWNTI